MSFSFSAAGTREEVLGSLSRDKLSGLGEDGERVRQLTESFLADAIDAGGDGTPVRYEVSAWGHHAPGSFPTLNVKIEGRYVT